MLGLEKNHSLWFRGTFQAGSCKVFAAAHWFGVSLRCCCFCHPQLCPSALWRAGQPCAIAASSCGYGELYLWWPRSHEVCYRLPKGVCPSGQERAIPQAHAGELETRGHHNQAPGEGRYLMLLSLAELGKGRCF